jgi:hypothetical protein
VGFVQPALPLTSAAARIGREKMTFTWVEPTALALTRQPRLELLAVPIQRLVRARQVINALSRRIELFARRIQLRGGNHLFLLRRSLLPRRLVRRDARGCSSCFRRLSVRSGTIRIFSSFFGIAHSHT